MGVICLIGIGIPEPQNTETKQRTHDFYALFQTQKSSNQFAKGFAAKIKTPKTKIDMKLKRTNTLFAGVICLAFGIVSLTACSKSIDTETATTEAASESTELTEATEESKVEKVTEKKSDSDKETKEMTPEQMYEKALSFERNKNYAEAVKWLLKSAEKGYADAQERLGYFYSDGKGVAQSDTEAFKWYSKAAAQGYADAACKLGKCYRYGKGVAVDNKKAREWFNKAAEGFSDDAMVELEKMDSEGL